MEIRQPTDLLIGEIFEEYASLDLDELSRLCAVDRAYILELIDQGVVSAVQIGAQRRFSGSALQRIRAALRLQRDLELNLAGVALVLELLDEIETLRRDREARR